MLEEVSRRKRRAALLSIVASGGLALLKLVGGVVSGSLALLSEAANSLVDVGTTIGTYVAVRIADKPADDEHHYGHGKVEAVAALAQTGLLLALAAGVAMEAARRMVMGASEIGQTSVAIGIVLFAIAVDFFRWRGLARIARETNSIALEADALHFSSDLVASLLVLLGLILAGLGYPGADSLAAMAVAVFIGVAGYRLGRRTVDTLMDRAPAGAADAIRDAAGSVPGVHSVDGVRVRQVGPMLLADVLIGVSRTAPLEKAQSIREAVTEAIRGALPGAEPTVTTEPRALDDETILERVMLIAAQLRTPVHHVTVQKVGGRLSISLDVEVDGRMRLKAAHGVASRVELAIRREFGEDVEVETHIEPLEAQGLSGTDVDEVRRGALAGLIARLADDVPDIGDVHSVRVRDGGRGLVVTLHLAATADRTVAEVHAAVDELERRVKQACADVVRIVVHAEPAADGRVPVSGGSGLAQGRSRA